MKNQMVKNLILFLVLFYLLSFVGFLFFSYFTFSADTYLPIFRKAAISGNAFALFLQYLPAAHFCAILFASSLSAGYGVKRDEGIFSILGRVILVLLISTFIFTLISETAYPAVKGKILYLKRQSELGRDLLSEARILRKSGDYENAASLLADYLRIDEDDQIIKDEMSVILREWYTEEDRLQDEEAGSAADMTSAVVGGGAKAEHLFALAKEYLLKGDYYSALYYVNLASEINPKLQGLTEIRQTALGKIGRLGLTEEEIQNSAIFALKKEGYDALFTFNNPVKAYYIYLDLQEEIPNDRDVARYLPKAEADLTDRTFFTDEGDMLTGRLFFENVLFANNLTDTITEIVYAKKLYLTPDASYLESLETRAWDSGGRLLYHYGSPLGKIVGSRVFLTAIHRERANLIQKPGVFSGDGQGLPEGDFPWLDLKADPDSLWQFSDQYRNADILSAADLLRMRKALPKFGFEKAASETELVWRFLRPFTFFCLSLVFLYIGLKGKITGKAGPLPTALAIPVWYYALFNVSGALSFFLRIAAGSLLASFSIWIALVLGVAVHGGIMAFLLLFSLRHV